ncbi:MAG: ester cyclase [Bacteroidota bacterium]
MQKLFILGLILFSLPGFTQDKSLSQAEKNKALARQFYEDLWLNNRTDKYLDYVASEYMAHDIGDRKNQKEKAIEQKEVADFFWNNGDMQGEFDYQIAEGDLVATRWTLDYQPKTLFGRFFLGSWKIPIINVFRFKEGKIVELWNHRHDIDTGMTLRFKIQGFLWGLLIGLVPTVIAFRQWRKIKRLKKQLAA